MSQFRFVLVVFYFTAVLIFAIFLRGANNRAFYRLSQYNARLHQLKQSIGVKQLQLESLINPSALSKRLQEPKEDIEN